MDRVVGRDRESNQTPVITNNEEVFIVLVIGRGLTTCLRDRVQTQTCGNSHNTVNENEVHVLNFQRGLKRLEKLMISGFMSKYF